MIRWDNSDVEVIPSPASVRTHFNSLGSSLDRRDRSDAGLPDAVDTHAWSRRDPEVRYVARTRTLELHQFVNKVNKEEMNRNLAYWRERVGFDNIETIAIFVDKTILDSQYWEFRAQGYERDETLESPGYPALAFRGKAKQWK
jgi:hypothetical protein